MPDLDREREEEHENMMKGGGELGGNKWSGSDRYREMQRNLNGRKYSIIKSVICL